LVTGPFPIRERRIERTEFRKQETGVRIQEFRQVLPREGKEALTFKSGGQPDYLWHASLSFGPREDAFATVPVARLTEFAGGAPPGRTQAGSQDGRIEDAPSIIVYLHAELPNGGATWSQVQTLGPKRIPELPRMGGFNGELAISALKSAMLKGPQISPVLRREEKMRELS